MEHVILFRKIYLIGLLILISCSNKSFGQDNILSLASKPMAGKLNTYRYNPPGKINPAKKLFVSYVYRNREKDYFKITPIGFVKGQFTFSIKVPDSTSVIVLKVVDDKNTSVDDNRGIGYLTYLYNKMGEANMAEKYIDASYILSYFAPLMLDLRRGLLNIVIINLFEKAYVLSPDTRWANIDLYYFYLTLLYQASPDYARQKLNLFASRMSTDKTDENAWNYAIRTYRLLGMTEKEKEIEEKALNTYPNGIVAKNLFLDGFYREKDVTGQSILLSMNEFETRFKDSSIEAKYPFLLILFQYLISRESWPSLLHYVPLFANKMTLSQLLNNGAEILCGEGPNTPGKNLDTARLLAGSALMYIEDTLKKLSIDDNDQFLKKIFDRYADSYAMILYKLKEYDSAFYYQSRILAHNINLKTEYLEHYITYAQKLKGAAFARDVLNKKLSQGVLSIELIQQLGQLYKASDGNSDEYKRFRNRYLKVLQEKNKEKIISVFGSDTAINFTLTDLDRKEMTLASLKNKTVVLDFWATWCGPCIAGFPKMQKLIDKYQHDPGVVFLFINSFETKNDETLYKDVRQLLKENNYSFKILFDRNNLVAGKYRVETIPANFVIDREGKIIFGGHIPDEVDFIINESLRKR